MMKKQSIIILKITFFKQIRSLFFFLLFSFGWAGFYYYFFKDADFSNAPLLTTNGIIILIVVGGFLVFITSPALFFHIDYLIRNRHEEYEIGNKKIIRRKKGMESIYHVEDIEDIYLYLFPTKFRNDFHIWAFDNYHFAKIVMKSSEVLYLTSLLYPSGIEKILDKYVKKSYWFEKRLFPTTLYCPTTHDKDNLS